MLREGRYPEGKPAYFVTTGCDLAVKDTANIPAAIAKIETAMAPPTKDQCEDWLVMLQTALAGGKRSAVSATMALELYAGALSRFPADCAKAACMELATRPRTATAWFPSLPELIAECERHAGPRQALLSSLKAWREPTEAERLHAEADGWAYAAARADDDAFTAKRSDPDLSSEAAEFAAHAKAEAKRLRIAGHQAKERASRPPTTPQGAAA